MTKFEPKEQLYDLNGSEQHIPLKNRAGENGDPTHADTEGALKGDLAGQVDKADADTQIADELKDLVDNN
ncbi:hypothetical protein PhaeoP72_04100 (plasmid) [Phaeobacter inhibens]|uniref:hypothetical protein n=1 Tax=Phaeobacter inhibens TaxID=221822 RepID=UPI000C9AE3A0|nr:hypothetical protein [Phaeobacter inhibens]AUR06017.1 hypothetical protein PhaeoP72_04100 [Phaeobacter inhibens]